MWVTYSAAVNFLEQTVFARIVHSLRTETHLRTGPTNVTVHVGILPDSLVVGAFAEQCAAVVALQYLLVLMDKTTVIAPGFTLLGHWGKVLACAIVTVRQFFFLLFFIVVVHSTLSFQTLNILGAVKIIKINKVATMYLSCLSFVGRSNTRCPLLEYQKKAIK
jgi:hypothetical protein